MKRKPEEVLAGLVNLGAMPAGYAYPASLDRLDPTFKSLLLSVQGALTEALRRMNTNVTGGVIVPDFHVDYMDAPEPNAIAFRNDGYSFIVITVPMAELIARTADRLSHSASIAQALGLGDASPELIEKLHVAMLSLQINFLASHELTHHLRGHVTGAIHENTTVGGLREQAEEADADSYAVYIVLAHLFNGDGRALALELVRNKTTADETLLALFIMAIGAFFAALPQRAIDHITVYKNFHPPEAVRMNYVMHSLTSWCNQNRPALEAWMKLDRYQAFMRPVAETIRGPLDAANADAERLFIQSAAGQEYYKKLEELRLQEFERLKQSVP